MAVVSYKPGNTITYIGLSGDTKPTNPNVGDKFVATDTPAIFIWNGTAWVTFTAPTGAAFQL